ncbi:phosphoribosylanthranilate isomerase [Aquihabitans daechungensis]|uniref:phosphoribosylanthranilate isomerase n=1 Tax=Aquihabitans daechungensis TaxID=1052257 RepID=UPI003BA2CA6D
MFVKICGITREDDALLAVAMGADALGFNFAPGSRRQISPILARDIARRLPPEILTVGIFRDEAASRVVEIVNTAGLRAAQLHGHESAESTRWVRERVPFVIKAFAAGDPNLARAREFGADAIMIDSPQPGSGEVFDWTLAEGRPDGLKVILAGGLGPDNVADAIAKVQPWGVDVATGVEAERGEPGQKDARKVRLFVENARAAAPVEDEFGPDPESGAPFDWMQDGSP